MRTIHDPVAQKNMAAWHIDCTDCSHCKDLKVPSDKDAQNLKDGREAGKAQIKKWLGI